jgi:energy-coupling factor transport system permease protein
MIFAIIIGLIVIVLVGAVTGQNKMRFFPSIKSASITPFSVMVYTAYFLLCMLPVIINILEEIKWRHIESKV